MQFYLQERVNDPRKNVNRQKMKQCYISGLVLLGFIQIQIKVAWCINCLNCRNIDDLSNCKRVIACKDNEACYIEKILSTENFQPLYNAGCRSMQECTLQYCNKQAYGDGKLQKKRQFTPVQEEGLTLCSECCFEDSCNTEGCGYARQYGNVSQCYSCDGVTPDGPPCMQTIDCDLTLFSCSVTLSPNHAYDLGCKYKRKQCELLLLLNQDQHDHNVKCCDTPLCNKNPYNKINKTAVGKSFYTDLCDKAAMNFTCPTGIVRPTQTSTPLTTAMRTSYPTSIDPHINPPITGRRNVYKRTIKTRSFRNELQLK